MFIEVSGIVDLNLTIASRFLSYIIAWNFNWGHFLCYGYGIPEGCNLLRIKSAFSLQQVPTFLNSQLLGTSAGLQSLT